MGGGRGRLFNDKNPSCCDKTWKREWQVTGYLFCTNYLQTLCILKKGKKVASSRVLLEGVHLYLG